MTARLALLLSSAILCTTYSSVAQGQGVKADDTQARVHFERGVELYREGSLDGALVEFERYYELSPNYKILYNIAQVQIERHEYVAALEMLQLYLSKGGMDIESARVREVRADMVKLRERIATLRVDVSVEGAKVYVNDDLRGTSPLKEPLLVNVGTCRLRVEKRGYATLERSLTVVGGERSRIVLTLVVDPTTADARARSRANRPASGEQVRDLTPFWVSLTVAAALGAATASFGILADNARGLLDDQLEKVPGNAERIDSARNKLRVRAALTDGFGVATLVAAGAAVYFLLDPPLEEAPAQPASAGLRLGPGGGMFWASF